ncbi:unnamed protein product [Paramecium primaurelia]|uniref:Uncharacterized protein n=1 Tax=Paramecium primaurelia TaxID=5886 RepID=A0A8S1QXK2_PARPR|nr:unnamed protein product [Paramecium primaurelia]
MIKIKSKLKKLFKRVKIKSNRILNSLKDYSMKEWHYLFISIHYLNKYQEAIECYDKAISINPKNDLVGVIRVMHYTNYRNIMMQYHVTIKLFLLEFHLQDYNEKQIHYLNQGRKQKLNNVIWLHWKKDLMIRITFRNNYQSYEALSYYTYHFISLLCFT